MLEELSLECFGVLRPSPFDDLLLAGRVPVEAIEWVASQCKSWIVMLTHAEQNEQDIASLEELATTGLAIEQHPFSAAYVQDAAVEKLLEAIERLPKPLLLQCDTGGRASAVFMLYLARKRGYTAQGAQQVAQDMALKFWTGCAPRWGLLREWLWHQLPDGREMQLEHLQRKASGAVVQQLFDFASSTFTYLVWDISTKSALLIDPVPTQKDRDLATVAKLGLELLYTLHTHVHANHTISGRISKERQAVHIDVPGTQAQCERHFKPGDNVCLGQLSLEVRATPGHTAGCVSYVLHGSEGPSMAFTGDALLIRGCGRTDSSEGNSYQLHNSVHAQIFSLPDDTIIYPGHDYKGRNVSTVAEEKQFNPLLIKSKEDFAKLMLDLVPSSMSCSVQD